MDVFLFLGYFTGDHSDNAVEMLIGPLFQVPYPVAYEPQPQYAPAPAPVYHHDPYYGH